MKITGGVALGAALAGCADEDPGDAPEDGDGDPSDMVGDGVDEDGVSVPDDASVAFAEPTDGATAANGVVVEMTAENVDVEPAGTDAEGTGHFHIIVNDGPVEEGEVIPLDEADTYVHYGDAGDRDVLDLPPGDHELTLQLGDGEHRALPLTDTVEVTVEEAGVAFAEPADGATVESPVSVAFETDDPLSVEEAGPLSQAAGHFHVLVNEDPVETGELIPLDEEETYVHFGGGETEADLDLPAGDHELTLQMGDGEHLALPETDTISVSVEGEDGDEDGDGEDGTAVETVTVAPDGTFQFDPASLTFEEGTTVEFVWEGGSHNINVTSQPDGSDWDGVDDVQGDGYEHEHTFETAGEYDYQCDPHSGSMTGSIRVEES